ncbi:hypothetical protein Tco_0287832, partial [Tanacetum coccineum]
SVPCKSKAASVPAASRNRPAVNSAGRPNPTGRVGQAAHLAAAQSSQYFSFCGLYCIVYISAGADPPAVTDADEFLLPAGTNVALDLQGIKSTQL